MSFNIEGSNGGNMNMAAGGLSTGTNAGTVQHTGALTYVVDGKFFSKAATNNITFGAGLTSLPIGMKAAFAIGITATGTYRVSQGALVPSDQLAPPPADVDNAAVFGLFVVSATTAAYVPGTTVLGTGNTVVYTQASRIPGSAL